MSYDDARAERDFRQNPPENAPGQGDDGWGDLFPEGSSSVEDMSSSYNSNINETLNRENSNNNQNNLQQQQKMMTSTEDKVWDATVQAGKGIWAYLKALVKSFRNNTSGDWHMLGDRVVKVSSICVIVGILFMIINTITQSGNTPIDLVIGGVMSMTVGVILLMCFDKDNQEQPTEEPEVEQTGQESNLWDDDNFDDNLFDEDEGELIEDEEEGSDDDVWDSILEDNSLFDEPEESPMSVDSDEFDLINVIQSVPEITPGTQTRQFLFESFCKVLPLVTPNYSEMQEIGLDSDTFFMFEDYLRGAAYQVGTKDENIPELESLYENPFVYRLNCSRPVGLKEQQIADEIANTYSRDENNKQVLHGVYATIETSVGKYTVNIFKGFKKDALGRQIGGARISLGDIYKQIPEFICSPEIEIPFVWGVNELGDTYYCDMKDNNSIIISGEPRGGKSWKGQSVVAQLAMFHSPKEIQFYIFDGKDDASDYKYLSSVLPHVQYFCGDMDKINDGLERVITKMIDEVGRKITEAGYINIKDYNKANPDKKLPYTYIIIDELQSLMNHFIETDQKEEGARFRSFLSTMVSKLPYTGIRFILFPHRIVNDIISKNTYSLVSCRAVVRQTNVSELKNAVEVTEKSFPYKLAQVGDMALKINEIAGGDVVYCHAEMLSSSNTNNKKLFDYIGAIWRKLEPDCDCIEFHGSIGGRIVIDKGQSVTPITNKEAKDNTNGVSSYKYGGFGGSSVDELDDLEDTTDVDESFWDDFLG